MDFRWQRTKPEDIWKRIDIRGPDECWPFLGKPDSIGYGVMKTLGKSYKVHRIAYALTHPGTISFAAPKDKTKKEFVLHTCDNRACANPAHLKLGSHAENMADMAAKGRAPKRPGEKNHMAKLTNSQAEEVRWISEKGIHYKEIARLYGVSRHCIWDVIERRTFNA